MNWKSAYLESKVMSASPVELISILHEYAILRVQEARTALANKDVPGRARAVSKTLAILGELDTSLDHQAGGEIAANLARLYQYMRERLTVAQQQQSDEPLAEVEKLMTTLGGAWATIAGGGAPAGGADNGGNGAPWGSFSPMEPALEYASQSWSA